MREADKRLLVALRSRPKRELDEDDLATLEYLTQEEAAHQSEVATPEELGEIGQKARRLATRLCPSCRGTRVYGVKTDAAMIWACRDCRHRWEGAPLPPDPFERLGRKPRITSIGPYSQSPVVDNDFIPIGAAHQRDPRKRRHGKD